MPDDLPLIDREKLPPIPSLWPPEAQPRHVYALETIVFEDRELQAVYKAATAEYLAVALNRGWKRVLLATAVTGDPREIVQVWQTPYPYPGTIDVSASTVTAAELNALREYRKFFEGVSRFERTLFAPVPYDPGDERGILDRNDTLLLVRANVKDGAMARLVQLKAEFFKPTVESPEHGWKLHCAGYVVSSARPASTIVQCWKIPNANQLGVTMSRMSHKSDYLELVAPCITGEEQNIYSCVSGSSD